MEDKINLWARLIFKESDFCQFRSHLLQPDQLERAGLLLLGKRQINDLLELYVHRMILPNDEDYCEQHETVVELKPTFVLDTFAKFVGSETPGYLYAHSHPFTDNASFSAIDNHYFPGMCASLNNYLKLIDKELNFLFVHLVWGRVEEGFTAQCFDRNGTLIAPIEEIRIIGEHGIRIIHSFSAFGRKKIEKESILGQLGQFQRNVGLLGETGQQVIQKTHLVICGVGGLGSFVATCAKGLGFREITLIDHEVLEESNLNRYQGVTKNDVGKPKVDIISNSLRNFDPEIRVNSCQARVQDSEAHKNILNGDFIINCLDNDSARLEVQILAARHLKPLLDLGSGIFLEQGKRTVQEIGGQATFYIPGGPCLLCQGLDPGSIVSDEIRAVQQATGYIQGTNETPFSIVTLNAVIAGSGLDLVIKYLIGFAEVPTYLKHDLLRYQVMSISFVSHRNCRICGGEGIEGKGDELYQPLPSKEELFPKARDISHITIERQKQSAVSYSPLVFMIYYQTLRVILSIYRQLRRRLKGG